MNAIPTGTSQGRYLNEIWTVPAGTRTDNHLDGVSSTLLPSTVAPHPDQEFSVTVSMPPWGDVQLTSMSPPDPVALHTDRLPNSEVTEAYSRPGAA